MLLEPLEAAITSRRNVVFVGFDVYDSVALYRDFEAAESLADSAKRLYGLRHG
jgi:hypothetical protein